MVGSGIHGMGWGRHFGGGMGSSFGGMFSYGTGQGFGFTQKLFDRVEVNFSTELSKDVSQALKYASSSAGVSVAGQASKLGAKFALSDTWNFYGYKSVRDINDVSATNQSWGLSGGSYSASSVGAEWIRESGDRFTFRLY